MSDLKQCQDCRFFEAHEEGPEPRRNIDRELERHGWCHRYAPSPLAGGTGQGWSDWDWPSVRVDDFCGEWIAK